MIQKDVIRAKAWMEVTEREFNEDNTVILWPDLSHKSTTERSKFALILRVITNVMAWAAINLFTAKGMKKVYPVSFIKVISHLFLYGQMIGLFVCVVKDISEIIKSNPEYLCTDKYRPI